MAAEDASSSSASGGSSNIKVCIRVRPFNSREAGEQCVVGMPTEEVVQINDGTAEPRHFNFDRCYWSHTPSDQLFATQETLMEELGEALLANALDGFNNCLFAYGQTGAGKTHSMLGGEGDQRGLLPRVLESLFKKIDDAPSNVKFQCKVSYLEIYNENLRDLLVPLEERAKSQLSVHYHPKIGTYVPGLSECLVTKYEEVNKMLDYGQMTRSVAATSMNATSSRSHCIFSFYLEKEIDEVNEKQTFRANVNLVDLAGSERQAKTNATGDRLKEGCMINQSLSTLAIVINKLAAAGSRGKDFVPFRNSKLTHLLQESLSGNSKTVMVAAISPAKSNLEETVGTLRFAQTCKKIQTRVVKNQDSRAQVINDLKAEIDRLRADLASGGASPGTGQAQLDEETQALKQKLEEESATIEKWQQQRAMALDDMALSLSEIANEMGVDPSTPQLINISTDPSLSGCLVYYLVTDEVTGIGSSQDCKIKLAGLGIQPNMCSLRNRDNREVTLELLSSRGFPLDAEGMKEARKPCSRKGPNAPGRVLVNGRAPHNGCQALLHCDRIIIGHAYCFRLTIPNVANENVSASGNIAMDSMEDALFEVVHEHADEFVECQALMESVKDRIGHSRAQEFLGLFGRTLPMIEEANLITTTVRPKDQLRFQLEVTSDIMRFTTDEPELIVRLFQALDGKEEQEVLGVFELPQFMERLAHIREVYQDFQHDPETLVLDSALGGDPWMPYGYNKVQEMLLDARHQLEEEQHRRELVENEARMLRRKLAEAEAKTRAALGGRMSVEKGRADPLELDLHGANEDALAASKLAARLLESLQQMKMDLQGYKQELTSPTSSPQKALKALRYTAASLSLSGAVGAALSPARAQAVAAAPVAAAAFAPAPRWSLGGGAFAAEWEAPATASAASAASLNASTSEGLSASGDPGDFY